MAAKFNNLTGPAPKFIFLVGALMFSLSSLPGVESDVEMFSEDLSSTSAKAQIRNCDIEGQLERNKDEKGNSRATCEISVNKKTHGSLVIIKELDEKTKKEITDISAEIRTEGKADCLTGDCDVSTSNQKKHYTRLANLGNTVEAFWFESEKDLKAQKAEKEKKRELVENCVEKLEDGEYVKLAGKEIESCKLDRLAELQEINPDKAAEYYSKHFRGKIKEMLEGCTPEQARLDYTCATKREQGVALLRKIGGKLDFDCPAMPKINPGQFAAANTGFSASLRAGQDSSDDDSALPASNQIKDSACDMYQFSNYTKALDILEQTPNIHPTVKQQSLANLKNNWGNYYKARGYQVASDVNSALFGIGDQMSMDLASFNQRMQQGFAAIDARHEDLLKPQVVRPGQQQVADAGGRGGRGSFGPTTTTTGNTATSLNPQSRVGAPANPGARNVLPMANTAGRAGFMPVKDRPAGTGAPIR